MSVEDRLGDPKATHPLPLNGCELLLVRHGQSTANAVGIGQGRAEFPLSALGEAQARATGAHLAREPVHAIYASPQGRAAQTAAAIAQATDAPVTEVPDLVEIDVGALSGLTWEQLEEVHPEETAAIRAEEAAGKKHARTNERIPGWERAEVVLARTWKAIAAIAAAHPNERVVVVAHGGVFNAFLTHLLTGDAREVAWAHSLGNCAVTHLVLAPGGVEARCVADRAHLATIV